MSAERKSRSSPAHHVLFALLALVLLALAVRLFLFQKDCQAEMIAQADRQQRMKFEIPARRGSIFANTYSEPLLLAASREVPSCFADVTLISDEELDDTARKASEALGLKFEDVKKIFQENRDRQFVWVKRELSDEEADRIRKLNIRALSLRAEWRRYYPNGKLAAHVVGFTSFDGAGCEGMELFADRDLTPVNGLRVVLADVSRRPIYNAPGEYIPPQDGRHVQLALNVVIQKYLEDALEKTAADYEAESAVGVVMDPRTGDVLALANVPTYDLNQYGQATLDERRNRAITDPYEPGSIFKPFVASIAFAQHKVRLGEEIFCHNGAYHCLSGRNLHDAHGYGTLTFQEILIKSSNIGMAMLGERMGNTALYEAISSFGFGNKTGLELKGEAPGLVNPLPQWNSYTTTSVPMGQEVGVTALQMATAFCVFGNGGKLLQPRLVKAVYDAEGNIVADYSKPREVRQVLPPDVCRTFLTETLAHVPTEGTGKKGRLNGWTSFGKTGTAQIPPYSSGRYTSSYIAGAPVMNTRLVCIVSVRKPLKSKGYYGGTVAAPAVKEVLEKSLAYLGVPYDDEYIDPNNPKAKKHAEVSDSHD